MAQIISILHEKMIRFEKFVSRNGWRTLTRTSKRLSSTLASQNLRGKSFYQGRRLVSFSKNMKSEISRMKLITKRSTLTLADKSRILEEIDSFSKEIELLSGFLGMVSSSERQFKQLRDTFKNWKSKINPEISLSRLELEKGDRTWERAFLIFGVVLDNIILCYTLVWYE